MGVLGWMSHVYDPYECFHQTIIPCKSNTFIQYINISSHNCQHRHMFSNYNFKFYSLYCKNRTACEKHSNSIIEMHSKFISYRNNIWQLHLELEYWNWTQGDILSKIKQPVNVNIIILSRLRCYFLKELVSQYLRFSWEKNQLQVMK